MSFSTFVSNTAPRGGAVFGPAAVTLVGNVFQGNTARAALPARVGWSTAGFNVSDETTCATAATSLPSTDAQLDPAGPADHGGPTQTIALLPGSPAIDLVPVSSGALPGHRPARGDPPGRRRRQRYGGL